MEKKEKKKEIVRVIGIKAETIESQSGLRERIFYVKREGIPYVFLSPLTEKQLIEENPKEYRKFMEHYNRFQKKSIEIGNVSIICPESTDFDPDYLVPKKIRFRNNKHAGEVRYAVEYWSSLGPEIRLTKLEEVSISLIKDYMKRITDVHIPFRFEDSSLKMRDVCDVGTILNGVALNEEQKNVAELICNAFRRGMSYYVATNSEGFSLSVTAAIQWIQAAFGMPAPYLIICDASKVNEYKNSIYKYSNLDFIDFAASLRYRKNIKKKITNKDNTLPIDVFIYPSQTFTLDSEIEWLKKFRWGVVFIDSVSEIEDLTSKRFSVLMNEIESRSKIIFPTQNQEITANKGFILPLLMKDRFCDLKSIQSLSSREVLTFAKDNIFYPSSYCRIILCEMSPNQVNSYIASIAKKKKVLINNPKGITLQKMGTNLLNICSHPVTTHDKHAESKEVTEIDFSAGKFVFLDKFFDNNKGTYRRVVISDCLENSMDILKSYLEKRGISYFTLSKTSPMSEIQSVQSKFLQETRDMIVLITQNVKIIGADTIIIFSSSKDPNNDSKLLTGPGVKMFVRLLSRGTYEEELFLRTLLKPISFENNANALSSLEMVNMFQKSVVRLRTEENQFEKFKRETYEEIINRRIFEGVKDTDTTETFLNSEEFFAKYIECHTEETSLYNKDEILNYANSLSTIGLIKTICSLKDKHALSEIIAILDNAISLLTAGERIKLYLPELIKTIKKNEVISTRIHKQAPFNDESFIRSCFFKEDKSLFDVLKSISNKDIKTMTGQYFSQIIQEKRVAFGYSIKVPIFWTPFVDYVILTCSKKKRTALFEQEFSDIEKINEIFDDKWCKMKSDLLTKEICESIPRDFYSIKKPFAATEYANKVSPDNEIMAKSQIVILIRAMILITPEPFDEFADKIIANTKLKYRKEVIQRYVNIIADLCGYRKSEEKYDASDFSWIGEERLKNINKLMNQMKEIYDKKEKILKGASGDQDKHAMFQSIIENGLIIGESCVASHSVKFPAAVIEKSREFERMNVWPVAIGKEIRKVDLVRWRKGIFSAIKKFDESIDDWMMFSDNEKCIIYEDFGKMNENGIPIGYRAKRYIQNIPVTFTVTQENGKVIYTITEEENKYSSEKLSTIYIDFCMNFYENHNYLTKMDIFSLFGFKNIIFWEMHYKE